MHTPRDECDESYRAWADDDDHHNQLMTDQSRDWTLIFSNCQALLYNSPHGITQIIKYFIY